MKATAVAPANIAFIKYWGRSSSQERIPLNASISMNLSGCRTTTTVEFSDAYREDSVLSNERFGEKEIHRITEHLDRIRSLAKTPVRARVTTENSFPKATGIASSASGFAALTVAAAGALGLSLTEEELTRLARLGSGSASRSIPDGFVKWEEEVARSLYPHTHWDLRDIVVVVRHEGKDVSSSVGQDGAPTSPNFEKRLAEVPGRIERVEKALAAKNFPLLGETMEEDCLSMHLVMQTQNPPLMYWVDETKRLMGSVAAWRKEGLPVYFTIDAGPNVHLICEGKDEEQLVGKLRGHTIIVNTPSEGAHLL